jgi:hypothetical protein
VTGDRAKRARVPEFVSTAVRKVEPVGGGMVRSTTLLSATEHGTISLPCSCR